MKTPPISLKHRSHRDASLFLALALVASALTTGCSGDTTDLDSYISEVKARKPARIEPIPEMKTFETFIYPTEERRDPFAPLITEQPTRKPEEYTGPRPDPSRPREPLEEFALDSLRMMGTLQQNGNLWALVKDPSGTIHRVQPGNYMGHNYGEITAIDETSVQLRELVPNGDGGWIERSAAVAIKL